MSFVNDVISSGIRAEDLPGLPEDLQRALEPLLRYVNTGIQGLAQGFSRNVSLTDNVRNEIQTVNLDHGVAQLVSLKKLKQARGVRSISVGSADGKTQHALAQPLHLIGTTAQNQVKVLAYFQDSTAVRVPVTLELTPEGSYTALTPSTGTWTAPTLLNSWVNAGGPNMTAGYTKDSLGFVHLRGSVKSGTIGAAAFVLPAGYRPSASMFFTQIDGASAAGYVKVDASGNVIPAIGSNVSYQFDGITFDTRS